MQDIPEDVRDLLLSSGLFDAEWYRRSYGDVDRSGLDPLDHFLSFAMELGRDPGPDHNELFLEHATSGFARHDRTALRERLKGRRVVPQPGRVLHAAAVLANAGRHDEAIRLGRAWLGHRAQKGLLILQANQALLEGRRADWLAALNGYLADFGMTAIGLRPAPHLLARLCTAPLAAVQDEVQVSVIMTAWNAEATIEAAARSILDQTWRNLELLVVDDASSDGTWPLLCRIAAGDNRVRLLRNRRNVGPYVSKNLALQQARGTWVTGQDADDWSHPQRIERQVRAMQATGGAVKAGAGLMIRMTEAGHFGMIGPAGPASIDGVLRNALISTMFDRDVLIRTLGNWDSVRFGADAEMMHRARRALGDGYRDMAIFAMLCLDREASLTGARAEGRLAPEMSPMRSAYLEAFQAWHPSADRNENGFYLPCPLHERPFDVPQEMIVPVEDAEQNFHAALVEDSVQGSGALSKDKEDRCDDHPAAEGPSSVTPAVSPEVGTAAFERAEEMLLRQNRLERQAAAEQARADALAEEVRRLTARLLAADDGRTDLEARLDGAIAARDEIRAQGAVEIARLTRMVLDGREAADLLAGQTRERVSRLEDEVAAAHAGRQAAANASEAAKARMSAEIAQLTRMVMDEKANAELLARRAQEQVSGLERQLSQMKDMLKRERKAVRKAQERSDRMERSLSWRLTRPVRFLRRMMPAK